MTLKVCDLCRKNNPNAKIKYKYRAKRFWLSWYDSGWEKIELCQECLDKIIKAESEGLYDNNKNRNLLYKI